MRKTYDTAFKLDIVKQIVAKKTTVSVVAKECSISRSIVSRWVTEYNRYGNQAFAGKGNPYPDKTKEDPLQAEIKRLKEENEILKKFAAFVKCEKNKI